MWPRLRDSEVRESQTPEPPDRRKGSRGLPCHPSGSGGREDHGTDSKWQGGTKEDARVPCCVQVQVSVGRVCSWSSDMGRERRPEQNHSDDGLSKKDHSDDGLVPVP